MNCFIFYNLFQLKTSYHPAFVVAFYLNCLPADMLQYIPRSTRFDWQHKDTSTAFGYDWFCQNKQLFQTLQQISSSKRLLLMVRCLLRVISIKKFITNYAASIKYNRSAVCETVMANIAKVTPVLGLSKTLRLLQMPYATYLKLKKASRCMQSLLNLCLVKHPTQLLKKDIAVIKNYCSDSRFLNWPLSSIYEMIKREGAAFFSIGAFYKYVGLLGLKRSLPAHRRKNHHIGIRAKEALKIIHVDVTVFKTLDNVKCYIHLVLDNFSRTILQWAVRTTCLAKTTFTNLEEVYAKYLQPSGIADCQLISDDGSENYGPVKDFIATCRYPFIQHLIAQKDIEFSNSMIEAAIKQIKYRFLYRQQIADYDALVKHVEQAVNDYNNRPHHVLHGLTPLEVLQGKMPDPHQYSQQTQQAKANRIIENKKIKCCFHSF